MNGDPRRLERRVRDRARLTLAGLVRQAEAILGLPGFERLADPDDLAATLFVGARLEGGPTAGDAWTPERLPRVLGGVASALYRVGNALVGRTSSGDVVFLPPPEDPLAVTAAGVVWITRLERATEGVGMSVLARGAATLGRLERIRPDDTSAWAERERGHLRAQLLRELGAEASTDDDGPRLATSVAATLAWETVTVVRERLLAPALPPGTRAPEIRVPYLLGTASRA